MEFGMRQLERMWHTILNWVMGLALLAAWVVVITAAWTRCGKCGRWCLTRAECQENIEQERR